MKNILSSFLSLIMMFMLLCVTPVYYWSIIDYAKTSTVLLASTRNVIDEVIDTKQLSDITYDEFLLDIATVSGYYDAKITRYKMIVNPTPTGGTQVSYMIVDDFKTYDSGDKISVKVTPVGSSYFEAISKAFLGLSINADSFTIVGRVR